MQMESLQCSCVSMATLLARVRYLQKQRQKVWEGVSLSHAMVFLNQYVSVDSYQSRSISFWPQALASPLFFLPS